MQLYVFKKFIHEKIQISPRVLSMAHDVVERKKTYQRSNLPHMPPSPWRSIDLDPSLLSCLRTCELRRDGGREKLARVAEGAERRRGWLSNQCRISRKWGKNGEGKIVKRVRKQASPSKSGTYHLPPSGCLNPADTCVRMSKSFINRPTVTIERKPMKWGDGSH